MANHGAGKLNRSSAAVERPAPARVMVVDDQETFRCVMRELIAATAGFVLAGESASGEDAGALVSEFAADFVVIDVRLSDARGVEVAVKLLEQYPDLVVLLVSVYDPTESIPLGPSGDRIPFVRKGDLRPRVLHEIWEERKPRAIR